MSISAAPSAASTAPTAPVAPTKSNVEPHLRPTPPIKTPTAPAAAPDPKVAPAAGAAPAAAPAAPATPVTDPAAAPATPAQDPKLTEQFAQLMHRDKALRDREAKLKDLEGAAAKGQTLAAELKADPLKVLKDNGISFEALADSVLAGGKATPSMQIQQLNDKIAGLEKRLEAKDQSETQREQARAVAGFKSEIKSFVDQNKEAYELIAAENQIDLVYQVVDQHYQETGRIMDVREAAEATEKWLYEQRKPLLSLKKFQSTPNTNPNAAPAATGTEPEKPGQPATTGPTTLTNTQAGNGPPRGQKEKLTHAESVRRAAAMLRFKPDK